MRLTSFMSEHTAEYVLVNDLVRRLTPAFSNLIPIFFWATREGNHFTLESMDCQNLRLVTCFARRPKVDPAAPSSLFMKINRELINYRHACASINIPVLVGLPIVKSLSALRLNSPCNWFDLAKFDYADEGECYVTISSDGLLSTPPAPTFSGPLTNPQIEELVNRSPIVSWSRAVDHIRDLRQMVSQQALESNGYWRFPFIGGYKPFFLLVLGDQFQQHKH